MPRGKKHFQPRTNVRGSRVTITKLPVVQCEECGKKMPHKPGKGNAAKVLTEHYNKGHNG